MQEKHTDKTITPAFPTYTIRENPRIKRMRLTVSPLGEVEVVIPAGLDRRCVAPFVARHEEWLRKTVARLRAQHPNLGEVLQSLPARIALPAIGEEWRVEYVETQRARITVTESAPGRLVVAGRTADKSACKAALRRWTAGKARRHLVPWLHRLSTDLGLPFASATVRGQRTRWGSCSSNGTISINWKLLFLPPDVVRYLLIHELCHTVHLNHSPRYWQLVAQKEPAYRVLDSALRRASRHVPYWAQYP